ncbi:S-adenosyl-L-methionine-dependent methyltransferase [Cylindrobasidium torrendii FP15055 ss-10]|uniref:rRNA adenine N(6)-methyltransferase n=1 Tax=Cylindrobasidium torrendii FP15055 ss-10 TaxID=1314674 RepID=A0A0D7BIT3_9AGAR|nr:S-adenosyl-L-methionine-dependent methyltransferase [Cylindrobasidium torrendii FP15055 ss-10]
MLRRCWTLQRQRPFLSSPLFRNHSSATARRKALPKLASSYTLPPPSEWTQYFGHRQRGVRNAISCPVAAKAIAEAIAPEGTKGLVVIEAFPGPGVLSRALLELPKERISKLVVLEDDPFLQALLPLKQAHPGRVHVIPKSGHYWDAYDSIGAETKIANHPWEEVHPSLRFVSHVIPSEVGEQYLSQWLRFIPDHGWIFKHGRVPMHLIVPGSAWKRFNAPVGDPNRSKITILVEALVEHSLLVPSSVTDPYSEVFWPPKRDIEFQSESGSRRNKSLKLLGYPQEVITVIPKGGEPIIKPDRMDHWDYVLRRLFAVRATPLLQSLKHLGAGAESLGDAIWGDNIPAEIRASRDTTGQNLTIEQWSRLIDAFFEWPFAPKNLGTLGTETTHSRRAKNRR